MKNKSLLTKLFAVIMMVMMVVSVVPSYSTNVDAAGNSLSYFKELYPEAEVIDVTTVGVSNKGKGDVGAVMTAKMKAIYKESIKNGEEGKRVIYYFPSGSYTLSTPMVVCMDNTVLAAETGANFTAKSKMTGMIRFNRNVDGVSMAGGSWNANKKAESVVLLNTNKDILVTGMSISKPKKSGVNVLKSTGVTVTNTKITSAGEKGIYATTNSVVDIDSVKIDKTGDNGLRLNKSTATIKNSSITSSGLNGISATDKQSKVYVDGCTITKNGTKKKSVGHGIGVGYGAYVEVKNTSIKSNKQCGISVYGSNARVVLDNCNVSSNGRHGIGAAVKAKVTVENSTFNSNKWHGIMGRDKVTLKIMKSTLNKNKVAGVCIENSKNAELEGNTISSNKTNGVYMTKGTATLKDNIIKSNKSYGIFAWEGSKATLVSGNEVKGNKIYDIGMNDGSKVTIKKGNKVGRVKK